jgi:hypothetical protein
VPPPADTIATTPVARKARRTESFMSPPWRDDSRSGRRAAPPK